MDEGRTDLGPHSPSRRHSATLILLTTPFLIGSSGEIGSITGCPRSRFGHSVQRLCCGRERDPGTDLKGQVFIFDPRKPAVLTRVPTTVSVSGTSAEDGRPDAVYRGCQPRFWTPGELCPYLLCSGACENCGRSEVTFRCGDAGLGQPQRICDQDELCSVYLWLSKH
jgi:hypothetical protein